MLNQIFCTLHSLQPQFPSFQQPFSISTNTDRALLNSLVADLIPEHKDKYFEFIINGEVLKGSLEQLIVKQNHSSQQILKIGYLPSRGQIKSDKQTNTQDWICQIKKANQQIVAALFNGSVQFYDLALINLRSVKLPTQNIEAFDYLQDQLGGRAVWTDQNGIGVMDLLDQEKSMSKINYDHCFCVSIDLINRSRVAAGSVSGKIAIFQQDQKKFNQIAQVPAHRNRVSCLILSDANMFSGSFDHHIKQYDLNKQSVVKSLVCKDSIVSTIDFKDDLLLSGNQDPYIKLWDLRMDNYIPSSVYKAHTKWVSSVRWNPEKQYQFSTSSYDHSLKVWDLRCGSWLNSVSKHVDKIMSCEWTEKESLVSGGADQVIMKHQI